MVKKEEKPIKSAASGAGSTSGLRNNLSHLFSGRFMIPSPDNASVATPPPVNTPCRSGRLVVTVTDHGPGISAENQKRLFKEVIQVRRQTTSSFQHTISPTYFTLHFSPLSLSITLYAHHGCSIYLLSHPSLHLPLSLSPFVHFCPMSTIYNPLCVTAVQFNPEKLQAGGGSGFGLFISKSIVDLHEGTIGVYR